MKLLKRIAAFTLVELLVVISIIGILVAISVPSIAGAIVRGQMSATLSNMRELHKVALMMSLDSASDTNVGWPGDMPTPGWQSWSTNVVERAYMSTNDFAKMISAPGIAAPQNTTPGSLAPGVKGGRAVVLYDVKETNDGNTVFLSTSNFTNSSSGGAIPSSSSLPYSDKGFVVFRKGGNGEMLRGSQAGSAFTNIIGSFSGEAY